MSGNLPFCSSGRQERPKEAPFGLLEKKTCNEELQSINEELETSKEELQSINEEFATINEELRVRNEALFESEERFRLLAENMDQLAWMAEADGSTVWFNDRWEQFSGIPIAEMRERTPELHQPDQYERVISSPCKPPQRRAKAGRRPSN